MDLLRIRRLGPRLREKDSTSPDTPQGPSDPRPTSGPGPRLSGTGAGALLQSRGQARFGILGAMEPGIRRALETERTIDITTTGRTSGRPRRIEMGSTTSTAGSTSPARPGHATGTPTCRCTPPSSSISRAGPAPTCLRAGHGHRGSGAAPDHPRAPARPAGPRGGPRGVDPREPAGRGRDPGSRAGNLIRAGGSTNLRAAAGSDAGSIARPQAMACRENQTPGPGLRPWFSERGSAPAAGAAVGGYLAFGEVPGAGVWIGAALIVASGSFPVYAEGRARRV